MSSGAGVNGNANTNTNNCVGAGCGTPGSSSSLGASSNSGVGTGVGADINSGIGTGVSSPNNSINGSAGVNGSKEQSQQLGRFDDALKVSPSLRLNRQGPGRHLPGPFTCVREPKEDVRGDTLSL